MKKLSKIIAFVLAIMSLAAIALPAMAEYNTTMYVVCPADEYVNLRKYASTGNTIVLAKLHRGDQVQADKYNSTWHKVKYVSDGETKTGYIMSEFLSTTKPSDASTPAWEERYGKINYRKSSTRYAEFANVQEDLNKFFETYTEYWGGANHNLTDYEVYPLAIDGYFGNSSEVAVLTFQQKMKLTQDGIVGPDTKQTLFDWCQKH